MEARVCSQGFHSSMSHLWSNPYFHTSHKVPDILISGPIHQVPFVAERERYWLARRLYGLNAAVSKHKRRKSKPQV